jgi:DNA-binding transcriptional LysR family regulator
MLYYPQNIVSLSFYEGAFSMNDNQLQTFLAIVKSGSFSQAEETLYISKQAIRKQMDALEKEVGTPLFMRSSRGVQLTPSGKIFYTGISEILVQKQSLLARCREAAQPAFLKLAVPAHPRLLMEKPLARFAQCYPEYIVQIVSAPSEPLGTLLQKGALDLAECAGSLYRSEMQGQPVDYTPIADVPYVCLVAHGHPLTKLRTLHLEDLVGYTVTVDRIARRRELYRALQVHGIEVAEFSEDAPPHLLEQIVNVCYAHGIYCTTAYFAAQMQQLAVLPLALPPKDIGLVYLHTHTAQVQQFLDCAVECRTEIQAALAPFVSDRSSQA